MISEKQAIRILKQAQIIGTLNSCMGIEVMQDLTDIRFKHPTLNNHRRRLKEAIDGISTHLGAIVQVKDRDEFDYEFSIEMHRLVSHFCGLSTEQLRGFMDRVDEEINSNQLIK